MAPENVRFFEGHKYMWDGQAQESRAAAEAKQTEYENDEFETQLVEEEEQFLVYTRRVVTEVVVEGDPPPA
jgi:hypothetical protein